MCLVNNRDLLLTVLEAGKSRIKAWVDSVSGENLLPGGCLGGVSSHGGKRVRALSGVSVISVLITLRKLHLLIPSLWGLGFNI